ncbi:uncharacterized protein LOC118181024 [Stegodyphus dumicola]|uniref:uncharacterized protein LOC118181024 n=1 Tax=Stegodyphus dumicola TaxID=202533 RepID=UPI0015AEA338|nr:uncharacterized protein LOC118181024 [Stegodyphus dumicola]
MNFFHLTIFGVLISFAQSITLSSLVMTSLTLLSLNKPGSCFFGIFRRRRTTMSPMIQEQPEAPEGPIQYSAPSFAQPAGFSNPSAGGNFFPGFPNSNFPGSFYPQSSLRSPQQSMSFPPNSPQSFSNMDSGSQSFSGMNGQGDEGHPAMNTEEAESFFTLLAETDESRCISRLVCELGANPNSAGEFGQTISEIIGSLTNFPPGSKVSEYNQVLQRGRSQGLSSCLSQYSSCDEESYQMVKKAQAEDSQSGR